METKKPGTPAQMANRANFGAMVSAAAKTRVRAGKPFPGPHILVQDWATPPGDTAEWRVLYAVSPKDPKWSNYKVIAKARIGRATFQLGYSPSEERLARGNQFFYVEKHEPWLLSWLEPLIARHQRGK